MEQQTYIIAFESTSKASAIVQHIKSYGFWAKITTTTWAVVTSKSAVEIRDELLKIANSNDKIFVVRSGVVAAWRSAYASNDWLKKNL